MLALSMLGLFAFFLLIGMPVAFAMGIAGGAAVFAMQNVNPMIIPQRLFQALDSFPLMAVPFFILSGELMNTGGITRRIVRFAATLVGHFRGGLGMVNVVSNIIMAGFSGSATADAVAIGTVMIPAMKEDGYPAEFAAGLTASASCIGPIIPPSVSMVIYGSITGLSVGTMFMGGFVPGVLIGLALMGIVWFYAKRYRWACGERATGRARLLALKEASWALLAPVLIIGGIITGFTTATEAGIIAAVYAGFVGMFIYREIKVSDFRRILLNAAINTTIPVIIIAGASIFGWVLAREQFSSTLTHFITGITNDPHWAYLLIIGMLFVVGLFVEGTAAMMIFVPVLFPVGNALGYNPIHFAIVIIITILIGTVTPPVGLQLFIAASIAKVSIMRVVIWPFVAAMVAILLLCTYIPQLVLFVPNLFF